MGKEKLERQGQLPQQIDLSDAAWAMLDQHKLLP
jgi:hypothetical protein